MKKKLLLFMITTMMLSACTVQVCSQKVVQCHKAPCPPITSCTVVYKDGSPPLITIWSGRIPVDKQLPK